MIQQRGGVDRLLKELADGVPGIHQVVVLSADGLRIARYGGDPDAADRIAAACAGLRSLAAAVAAEMPHSGGRTHRVVIEIDGGCFAMMAAGPHAYLAVLADADAEAGLMSNRVRDLVLRIGSRLTSPPRRDGQTV